MGVQGSRYDLYVFVRALLRRYGLGGLLEDDDVMGRLYKVFVEVFVAGYVRGREDCFSECLG